MTTDAAVHLADWAQAFDQRLQGLADDLDPSWRAALSAQWSVLAHLPDDAARRRFTAQMVSAQCGGWPPLQRWLEAPPRLALLHRPELLRQLCTLALARRLGVLRCAVEREVRQGLKEALGPNFEPLSTLAEQGRAVADAAVAWSPLHWACVGYGDWLALLQPEDDVVRRIVRLSLPRGLLNMPQQRQQARGERSAAQALAALHDLGVDWPC